MPDEVRQRINAIFRHNPPQKEKLFGGMDKWAKELDGRFSRDVARRSRIREALGPHLHNVRHQLDPDSKLANELAALGKNSPHKLPNAAPPKHTDRIFGGSVGASYGPPYDVQWTWSQQAGDVVTPTVSADESSGTLQLAVVALDNGAAATARAAVGNWLVAPLGTSTMKISAAPAYSWFWEVGVRLGNQGRSVGWLGFLVQSCDVHSGDYVGQVVLQQTPQWDIALGFLGLDEDSGSTTGFPLQAEFTAIEGLFYVIWIWFGVYAFSDGDAWAEFPQVSVPYFTWENG